MRGSLLTIRECAIRWFPLPPPLFFSIFHLLDQLGALIKVHLQSSPDLLKLSRAGLSTSLDDSISRCQLTTHHDLFASMDDQ